MAARRPPTRSRRGALEAMRVEDVFDEGLHEFLTRFIGDAAALGQAVHDSYLSGDLG